MIVVDASTIAAFILKEPGWERLIELIKDSYTVDHALREVSNAIWRAYRKGLISSEDASLKFKALMKMVDVNLKLFDEKDLIDQAFRIALEHDTTLYDALYIALALKLEKPLLTFDQAQAKIAEKLGVKVISI